MKFCAKLFEILYIASKIVVHYDLEKNYFCDPLWWSISLLFLKSAHLRLHDIPTELKPALKW